MSSLYDSDSSVSLTSSSAASISSNNTIVSGRELSLTKYSEEECIIIDDDSQNTADFQVFRRFAKRRKRSSAMGKNSQHKQIKNNNTLHGSRVLRSNHSLSTDPSSRAGIMDYKTIPLPVSNSYESLSKEHDRSMEELDNIIIPDENTQERIAIESTKKNAANRGQKYPVGAKKINDRIN